MQTFLLAFAAFALAVTGLAVGVILRRKSLQGSCGGLANLRDERGNTMCEACTNPSPTCAGEPLEEDASLRAHPAGFDQSTKHQ